MLNEAQTTDVEPAIRAPKPHHVAPSILREYDIRGVVGETLTVKDAESIGASFGSIVRLNGGSRICIGCDGRTHSQEFYEAVTRGVLNTGVNVMGVGVGPTPMLYYADRVLKTDGAIMVTGSHNPPEFNGFKIVLGHLPFFGDDIQQLGLISAKGNFTHGNGQFRFVNLQHNYLRALQSVTIKRPLKVAWDPGNGAAGDVVSRLTDRLSGEHIVINADIDGTFPNHHPDPTVPENLEQLREVVMREHCDLGVAFDGDGDRIGVIDDEGEIIWGDQLLDFVVRDVLYANPGATIIADVKASQVLFDHVTDMGGNALMWKTGHSLIKSKMAETGALVAGEMSGHMFFADRYFGFDDAIYAAIRIMEFLSIRDKPISYYRKDLPQVYNTPELRIDCPDEMKFKSLNVIKEAVQKNCEKANTTDGLRVSNKDGWWLIRASNTQPALVARCESKTKAGLASLKQTLIHYLDIAGVEAPKNILG